METIDNVIDKKMSKSLLSFMKLVDPEHKFAFTNELTLSQMAWNRYLR